MSVLGDDDRTGFEESRALSVFPLKDKGGLVGGRRLDAPTVC